MLDAADVEKIAAAGGRLIVAPNMDAAVIGIPHHTLGEEPAAIVHLAPGHHASEAELRAWVGERLAAFKVPVAIRFHPETLPRNANGKILKRELKALFADRS